MSTDFLSNGRLRDLVYYFHWNLSMDLKDLYLHFSPLHNGEPPEDTVQEGIDRVWYYLGLMLIKANPHFRRCMEKDGHLVAPTRIRFGTGRLNKALDQTWGSQDQEGDLFRLDRLLPDERIVERLETTQEPEAFFAGAARAESLGALWAEEIDSGKRVSKGALGHVLDSQFLPPSVQEEAELTRHLWQGHRLISSFPMPDSENELFPWGQNSIETLWKIDSLSFGHIAEAADPPEDTPTSLDLEAPAQVAEEEPEPDGDSRSPSLAEELEKIQTMLKEGFLSEEQAEQAKRRLLDG